jgi:hypothetical protein
VNDRRIVRELVSLAEELAAERPGSVRERQADAEKAEMLILTGDRVIRRFAKMVEDFEESFQHAQARLEGLAKAGGGMTEGETFLKPLRDEVGEIEKMAGEIGSKMDKALR